MPVAVGLLLPRSTDYPSLGFDIVDGLRCYLQQVACTEVTIVTESIGYGEDAAVNYARAEKLLLQDKVTVVVAYCQAANAEQLYGLAAASGKPFIFIDPGMQLPAQPAQKGCYHICLQGIHACRLAGFMAGEQQKKVLMATSFYDGGYRGPWSYTRGLEEAGGSVCGNYVSAYKEAEFTIESYLHLLHRSGAQSVAACFSSYLADLFLKALKQTDADALTLPFYCSPFMAEEQMLSQCDFPGGTFYAIVPWSHTLNNDAQQEFATGMKKECNKVPTIFSLLGWEAGAVIMQLLQAGVTSLGGFSWKSPRGTVTIHPGTHYTYAPLYKGMITAADNGKCMLLVQSAIPVTGDMHLQVMNDKPGQVVSGWRNNYLCI